MKKRFGWTVWGIVGLVFASVSLVFIPVGLVVDAAKPGEYGRVFLYVFVGMGAFFLILGLAFLSADLRRRYLLRRAWYGGNADALNDCLSERSEPVSLWIASYGNNETEQALRLISRVIADNGGTVREI